MNTKPLALVALAASTLVSSLPGAIPVTDALLAKETAELHLEDIAKFKDMIDNQVQQIDRLKDQLNQLLFIATVIGDPAATRTLSGVGPLLDIKEVGASRADLSTHANAQDAQSFDGLGLFQAVGTSFVTIDGQGVQRDGDTYRPVAAIIKATSNYDSVFQQVPTTTDRCIS